MPRVLFGPDFPLRLCSPECTRKNAFDRFWILATERHHLLIGGTGLRVALSRAGDIQAHASPGSPGSAREAIC
jgi:hypothetical protein